MESSHADKAIYHNAFLQFHWIITPSRENSLHNKVCHLSPKFYAHRKSLSFRILNMFIKFVPVCSMGNNNNITIPKILYYIG